MVSSLLSLISARFFGRIRLLDFSLKHFAPGPTCADRASVVGTKDFRNLLPRRLTFPEGTGK